VCGGLLLPAWIDDKVAGKKDDEVDRLEVWATIEDKALGK
jgi:hypothetical protein